MIFENEKIPQFIDRSVESYPYLKKALKDAMKEETYYRCEPEFDRSQDMANILYIQDRLKEVIDHAKNVSNHLEEMKIRGEA